MILADLQPSVEVVAPVLNPLPKPSGQAQSWIPPHLPKARLQDPGPQYTFPRRLLPTSTRLLIRLQVTC